MKDFTVTSNAIAVFAIAISVLTAFASLVSARKIAARQRTFELRFYQLRMLDPAKATLRRIVIDHDQRMNVVTFLEGEFSLQAHEDLGKLQRCRTHARTSASARCRISTSRPAGTGGTGNALSDCA